MNLINYHSASKRNELIKILDCYWTKKKILDYFRIWIWEKNKVCRDSTFTSSVFVYLRNKRIPLKI